MSLDATPVCKYYFIAFLISYILVAAERSGLGSPKDYALSGTGSRVKELANFFEVLDGTSKGEYASADAKVVLSLSESASKLYVLTTGQSLSSKCNSYVKLLGRPNIRTVATIGELVQEQMSFNEVHQGDANLIAKLESERQFDALARIQTIIQTLESEMRLGKSSFETSVQKELLDCINFYSYRHQRAVLQVVQYARESLERLPQSTMEPSPPDIVLAKFAQSIESIKSVEMAPGPFNYHDWLEQLATLQRLASGNDYMLPHVVVQFLAEPSRAKRLSALIEIDRLKEELLAAESGGDLSEDKSAYERTLAMLRTLCETVDIEIPDGTCALPGDEQGAGLRKHQSIRPDGDIESPAISGSAAPGIGLNQLQQPPLAAATVNVPLNQDVAKTLTVTQAGVNLLTRSNLEEMAPSSDLGNLGHQQEAKGTHEQPKDGFWARWLKAPEATTLRSVGQMAGRGLKDFAPSVRQWPNKLWSWR